MTKLSHSDPNFYNAPPDGGTLPILHGPTGQPMNGNAPHREADAVAKRDWGWQDLGDLKDTPAATHLVNGLLVNGNLTLLYAPIKVGKSRLLMGLLAALAPGGPQFCGMDLKDTRTLLFSEEPPTVLGERVRDFGVPTGMHIVNTAAALAMPPAAFADEVRAVHKRVSDPRGPFGLIAIDTLGAFVNCKDWNDYTSTTAAMAPLRDLARSLPKVAILLLHHQSRRRLGGADHRSGQELARLDGPGMATCDQLVRMVKKNGHAPESTVGVIEHDNGARPERPSPSMSRRPSPYHRLWEMHRVRRRTATDMGLQPSSDRLPRRGPCHDHGAEDGYGRRCPL